MTVEEFDQSMLILTNFLAYMTDPSKVERETIGTYTLLYLFIFTMLSYIFFIENLKRSSLNPLGVFMVSLSNRTSMALFSDPMDHYSHRVRIVMQEKGVTSEIIDSDMNDLSSEILEVSPYAELPVLVDRDVCLYDSLVLMWNILMKDFLTLHCCLYIQFQEHILDFLLKE